MCEGATVCVCCVCVYVLLELSSTSSGIKSVVARQIYDPNGTPTIYAESDNFSGSIRCQCSHI